MRIFYSFVVAIIIALTSFFFLSAPPQPLSERACAFCNAEVLAKQTFYEGTLARALVTHKPVLPGHCLVIPKRHVERFEMLTEEELVEMGELIKKVNRSISSCLDTPSYLLLQKNGIEAGQSVPHVHFHYLPKKAGDSSSIKFMAEFLIAELKSPLPPKKIEKHVEEFKEAMTVRN